MKADKEEFVRRIKKSHSSKVSDDDMLTLPNLASVKLTSSIDTCDCDTFNWQVSVYW